MTAPEIKQIYATENGIIYMFDNIRFSFPAMLIIVIGAGVIFFATGCIIMKKYRKK